MIARGPESIGPRTLHLAALIHNVHHLLWKVSTGNAPPKPHEQDRLDALRWLPEIDAALAELPEPRKRIIQAGDTGGADVVEHYFDEGAP